jgi:hypothetical protein
MSKNNKLQKDIDLDDIDKLFNNNDTSVLTTDKDVQNTVEVPKELDISTKTNKIPRPKNVKSETKRIKDEKIELQKSIDKDLENNDTHKIHEINTFENIRKYIKKILNYKDQQREKNILNRSLINELVNKDIYKSTDCTFHIFQPKHIMGDDIYCSCKFCSVEKKFTQSEWTEYCIKYRKWF